jgi:hypothetical protein
MNLNFGDFLLCYLMLMVQTFASAHVMRSACVCSELHESYKVLQNFKISFFTVIFLPLFFFVLL